MTPDAPLLSVWYGTGNNVMLVGDIGRRVLHIRLNSNEERPEERAQFRHANLLEWVRQNRPRLVRACLTILRGYCSAGRPIIGLKPWGSFEGWTGLVRNAVAWIGEPDPGHTRAALADQSDTEANALRALIEGLDGMNAGTSGVTAAQMIATSGKGNDHEGLRDAIGELCPTRDGKPPSPKQLGKRLSHLRRRVVGGRYIERRHESRAGVLWAVFEAKQEK